MGINEILCKEYDAVRGEIITGLSNRIRVLSVGMAVIGLMWTAATTLYTRSGRNGEGSGETASRNRIELAIVVGVQGPDRDGSHKTSDRNVSDPEIAGMIFVIAVPVMALFIGWLWFGEYERVQKAGKWQYQLEDRINTQAQQDLNEVKQFEMTRSEVAPPGEAPAKTKSFTVTLSKVRPSAATPLILTWEHTTRDARLGDQTFKQKKPQTPGKKEDSKVGHIVKWMKTLVDPAVLLLCATAFVSMLIGSSVLGWLEKRLAICLFLSVLITVGMYVNALCRIRRLRTAVPDPERPGAPESPPA